MLYLIEYNELSSNFVAWVNLSITVASLLYRTFKRILRCAQPLPDVPNDSGPAVVMAQIDPVVEAVFAPAVESAVLSH